MELTFEDLVFYPSSSHSSVSSEDTYAELDCPGPCFDQQKFLRKPAADTEGEPVRRDTKGGINQKLQLQQWSLALSYHPAQLQHALHYPQYYHLCPGAAHRSPGEACRYYVDPRSGVGKCHHPDCTWGYANGKDVITDLRGFAYSSRGDPVMSTPSQSRTKKHLRLSLRR